MPLQQTEAAFQVISRVSRQDRDHQLGVKYCQLKLSQPLPLVTIRDQDVTCSGGQREGEVVSIFTLELSTLAQS